MMGQMFTFLLWGALLLAWVSGKASPKLRSPIEQLKAKRRNRRVS